jgi:multidrug efflux pump subunit AcrB/ABC-type multidrug transport system ATPase subunit
MNPLRIVIERKVLIGMFFTAITLLGYFSYRRLPMEIYPGSELSTLTVTVSSRTEVDPSYLERQAVLPMESAIGRLEGIQQIETTIDQRRGAITVTYSPGTKMKYASLKLEQAAQEVRTAVGEDFTINVQRVDTERISNVFMRLQVRGTGGLERVRAIIDSKITRELESINGIAAVNVVGGRTKSVDVLLDEDAGKAYSITSSQIRQALTRGNQSKAFVGQAWDGSHRYFVNLTADYADIRDIENLVIRTDGPVYLRDVAQVTFGAKEETSISRVNGMDAVTIQLSRDSQANMIELAHTTRAIVDRLNRDLKPEEIETVIQSDAARDMERNLNIIKQLALTGALLAMAVLWFFLRKFKLVTVIVFAIPVSILCAFNFFYGFGITINMLTLMGIALTVGMLLDNGVVVLENIMRLRATHRDRDTSVLQGTSEVWRSILAGTITTITVFLPFAFSSDYVIRLIGQHIGVSVISTLLISLVTAFFLTPMLIHLLLRAKDDSSSTFTRISYRTRIIQIYTLLFKTALRFPASTALSAVAVFLATLIIAISLSMNVSREVQLREFPIYLTARRGATLEATDKITRDLEARLADLPEKQDITTQVYAEQAAISVLLREDYEKIGKRSIPQIKADIQRRIDEFSSGAQQVSLSEPRAGRMSGSSAAQGLPLERAFGIGEQRERILLKGSDFQLLRTVAEDIQYYLQQLESIQSVSFNVQENRPEAHLHFDRDLMSRENIPLTSVSSELSSFGREVSTSVPYKQGTEEYEVVIRSEDARLQQEQQQEEERDKTAEDLRSLRITGSSGAAYELDQLSRLIFARGRSSIHRVNQERQVEVTYRFQSDINESKPALESARSEVDDVVYGISIPPGVAVEVIHNETDVSEFTFLIAAAFILIYMILASVFESFTSPLVMMFTIPLAAIGALGALILTHNSLLNASALLGFLILLGVVVNNGILLMDFTRILRRRGFRKERALMTAGRARLRPILITSITTIAGMIPLAMGKAEYVSMIGAPFAIAVVGGLSLSTLFTLVLIPTVYSGLESALDWLRGLNPKLKAAQVIALALMAALIYTKVDNLLWQFVYWIASLVIIPSVFYFVTASLRRAGADIIPRSEPLNLHIRRLVKTYDDDSRFVREWKKGARLDALLGTAKEYRSIRDLGIFTWTLPILGFLIYFTYFYLWNSFWTFVFSHLVYFIILGLWSILGRLFASRAAVSGKDTLNRISRWGFTALVWGLPAANLAAFHWKGFRPALMLFIGIIWYGILLIRAAAVRFHRLKINLVRMQGRFANVRRIFYQTITSIPIIGRKKRPFRALDTVSLEISSGMFGLLGPNGAGKTTIMRIICGILNQSMGTMRINGIDFREKREELQGLIGYLPQEFGTYENLTAREFLDYIAILKGIGDRDRRRDIVNQVLSSVHLAENGNQRIGSFSGGMKQRVGIAMTLLHLPRILVVDEPTAGLDPRERIRFRNLLVELSRERIVIFSTHIIEDISSSCNRVAVLNRGNLSYLGSPLEMTEAVNGRVWQLLLDEETFSGLRGSLRIVHHMRVGDQIRVRCLSETPPLPSAEQAHPTLEDAYLWLLGTKIELGEGRSQQGKESEK